MSDVSGAVAPGAVDGWVARIDDLPAVPAVDAAERARARGFVRAEDARAFLARRGFVRSVLAGVLGLHAHEFDLVAEPSGKLRLEVARAVAALDFSVSSSGGFVVCAVSRHAVGVDVEALRPGVDWGPVARRYFSPGEAAALSKLGADGFYLAWTMKEAVIKARGGTIAHDLAGLDITRALLHPGARCKGFSVYGVALAPGFASAVATRVARARIQIRDWASDVSHS